MPHTPSSSYTVTTAAFWKNGSLTEHVLQEITSACVDTKLSGIEATCIASYIGETLAIANEATVILCVCVYEHTR